MQLSPAWTLALLVLMSCQPEGGTPGAVAPASSNVTSEAPARRPVFADRTKEADYDHARATLAEILQAGARGIDSRQATELGFKCASLRGSEKSLASEQDPLVVRLVADIGKTCGFDLPVATAKVEILRIEARRKTEGPAVNVKGECLGLKLAIGDIGSVYLSNPDVVDLGGKYPTYCAEP